MMGFASICADLRNGKMYKYWHDIASKAPLILFSDDIPLSSVCHK